MSIQNLIQSDVDSITIGCTVGNAITGTCNITLRRLNNIITMTISQLFGTANGIDNLITITPSIPIPTQFRPTLPVNPQINRAIVILNNLVEVIGQVTYSVNFNTIAIQQLPITVFTGSSGFNSECIFWPVPTL
jgi:hypothetical protein